jgi:hypothetical protein
MIVKHHMRRNKKTGERTPGPTDRQGVRRLLQYIQRDSAMGRTVANDFPTEDCSLMADEWRDLMSRSKVRVWARHFTMSWHPDDTAYAGQEEELVKAFREKFKVWRCYARTHCDKDHGHIHLAVLARIPSGSASMREALFGGGGP